MSEPACDLLPAELLARSELRESDAVVWVLDDATAVLDACRERRLRPTLMAVVEVRDGRVLAIDAPGRWGFAVTESRRFRSWDAHVEAAVQNGEDLVRRAHTFRNGRADCRLAFVLRAQSVRSRSQPAAGLTFVAILFVGPVLVYGLGREFSTQVKQVVDSSVLTAIGVWVAVACAATVAAIVADRLAARRIRTGIPGGDAPRRAGGPDAHLPRVVAHIAILVLLLWVWSPMGAALIFALGIWR